ncbi:MAG: cytochrome c [Proteobacteria bacterium]|nr:cytochrome c [Pseudomonadota bacterium]
MNTVRRLVATVLIAVVVLIVGGGIFVYSGVYDIGADDHHTRPVEAMLQTLRERSIQARAADLSVPNLDDPQLVLKGAGQYAAMCTGCHLAPGVNDSELRVGMYPQPPNLSQVRVDPKTAFWVIKHGIKMSAMPAWGVAGHDDPTIWSMVAFLQQLPDLSPAGYKAIVAKAPPDEDMPQDHDHGEAAHGGHGMPEPAGGGKP